METKMYKAFESFLSEDSWPDKNWPDTDRFYQALKEVAGTAEFSPETMGTVFAERYRQQRGTPIPDDLLRHFVHRAEIIQRYIKATA